MIFKQLFIKANDGISHEKMHKSITSKKLGRLGLDF
jgi:hypothetical protein